MFKKPKVTLKEAPLVARMLRQRIDQLGISLASVANKSDLSLFTVHSILKGQSTYKVSSLEAMIDALRGDDEWTLDFQSSQKKEIEAAAFEEASKKLQHADPDTNRAIGTKIRVRREALGLSRAQVVQQLRPAFTICSERLNQYEQGKFRKINPCLKAVLLLLGYPRDEFATLDQDIPSPPAWLIEKRQHEKVARKLEKQSKKDVGEALRTLRQSKGVCNAKISFYVEQGGYSQGKLEKTLVPYRLPDSRALLSYVADQELQERDMGEFADRIGALGLASRFISKHWNVSLDAVSARCPHRYPIALATIHMMGNPENPFFAHSSFETAIALMTALFNTDRERPASRRVLEHCPSLRLIASHANKGGEFTYGRQVKALFVKAMDEVIDVGVELEREAALDRKPVDAERSVTGFLQQGQDKGARR